MRFPGKKIENVTRLQLELASVEVDFPHSRFAPAEFHEIVMNLRGYAVAVRGKLLASNGTDVEGECNQFFRIESPDAAFCLDCLFCQLIHRFCIVSFFFFNIEHSGNIASRIC